MEIMAKETKESIISIFSQIPKEESKTLDAICGEILQEAHKIAENGDYTEFLNKVEKIFREKVPISPGNNKNLLRREMIAKFASNLPSTIDSLDLPESVLRLYPEAFKRLADHLESNEADAYDKKDDFFRKDIRFVLGLAVPCGTLVVDLTTYYHLSTVLRCLLRPGNIEPTLKYLHVGGTGPWLGIHADPRYLKEFNEQGWDECYLRIAELLEHRPSIRGMVGTSWFYDPQLLSISPRLSYLQQRPLDRGAFFMRNGVGLIDIERAISKSSTRRRLYNEGKYMPVCYTLLWPRKKLIEWAHSVSR